MSPKDKKAERQQYLEAEKEKERLGEQSPETGGASGSASAAIPSDEFPAMPLRSEKTSSHRHRIPNHEIAISALVARPVPKKERNSNPKAKAAVDIEWEKL